MVERLVSRNSGELQLEIIGRKNYEKRGRDRDKKPSRSVWGALNAEGLKVSKPHPLFATC